MNAKTLTALKESIAHWKRMKKDPDCGEEPYKDDCPLCQIFYNDPDCGDCPGDCFGAAPWDRAEMAWCRLRNGAGGLEGWRDAAQKEIDFLESLLPKVSRKKVTKK